MKTYAIIWALLLFGVCFYKRVQSKCIRQKVDAVYSSYTNVLAQNTKPNIQLTRSFRLFHLY
jgi:hypothetical protein